MTAKPKTPEQRQHDIHLALRKATAGGPIKTAPAVRALIDALWATARNEWLPPERMIAELALLSGMAVAVMSDYARQLEAGKG